MLPILDIAALHPYTLSLGRQDRHWVGVANTDIERIGLKRERGAHWLDEQGDLVVAVSRLEQESVLGIQPQLDMQVTIILDAQGMRHARDADAGLEDMQALRVAHILILTARAALRCWDSNCRDTGRLERRLLATRQADHQRPHDPEYAKEQEASLHCLPLHRLAVAPRGDALSSDHRRLKLAPDML
jgi:hypothetical protein